MRKTMTALAHLLTWVTVAVGGQRALGAADGRPNFLIILADDLGFSDLGCYGGEIHTPNLDQLAAEGLRYTQFYNTARCWPTRAATLTGYYAQQVGFDELPDGPKASRQRPEWAPLLPERLRDLGYHSYHSGKWHLDGKPTDSGFVRSYELDDHDRHFNPKAHSLDGKRLPPVKPESGYYSTTAIADYAVAFLREHAEQHRKEPFFGYVAFTAPHFPLHAPAEDIEHYRDAYLKGWDAVRAERARNVGQRLSLAAELSPLEPQVGPPYDHPRAIAQLGPGEVNRELAWNELTDEQQQLQARKMAIHAAMVDRMDQEIGRVLDQLRAMRAFDNTVILFLSDNGASAEIMVRGDGHERAAAPGSAGTFLSLGPGWSRAANTPFRRHKTWVHEGGIATPLIVHWPQGIRDGGELRHAVGHVIDIWPTVVSLAGGRHEVEERPRGVPARPGRDVSSTFAIDEAVQRDAPLWWYHNGNRALRDGNWKLVAERDGPWELYDLAADRSETKNLAASEPGRMKSMSKRWTQMTEEFRHAARNAATP